MKVFARVPFTYAGKVLDRGELTETKGTPRDEKLLGLNYLITYNPTEFTKLYQCDMCGKKFVTPGFYESHKRKKGGCLADSQVMTKQDTAFLLDVEEKELKTEDFEPHIVNPASESYGIDA